MSALDRCGGPDCPHCGCNDTRVLQPPQPEGWFLRSGKARCRHCGQVFFFGREDPSAAEVPPPIDAAPETPSPAAPDGAVIYHVIRCPACGSADTAVTRTARPIRYHKCRACQETFKSVEG